MKFSVVVPAYNAESTLPGLLDSLSKQNYSEDFEVIVVDDFSTDSTVEICRRFGCKLITNVKNSGPARCRNQGAARAVGEFLIFTDSDCIVPSDWIECFDRAFALGGSDVIMGKLVLLPSTVLGNSISALGFPAGGSLGFEKVWKVSEEGYTDSLSSCNFAIKKDIFLKLGGFDESFPYAGGEDTFLAHTLVESGYRIRYCPHVIAYHPARASFGEFLRWQFKRGKSSLIFAKKISRRSRFVSLRLWSTKNVIKYNFRDKKFPLILLMLGLSLCAQISGVLSARLTSERENVCEF